MLEIFYKMQPLDYVYLLVGIILFIFAIQSFLDKEHKYRIGTGLFWLLYSVSFIFGSYLSKEINGWLVIAMAAIVLVKQLGKGHYFESPIEFKKAKLFVLVMLSSYQRYLLVLLHSSLVSLLS